MPVVSELPVKILRWQSDTEQVSSAADIAVLTSENEGTLLSSTQVGMAGLPVVTTKVGSVPKVVLNGVIGMITALDIQEFADAIEKLSNSLEIREQKGVSAREFTLANSGAK